MFFSVVWSSLVLFLSLISLDYGDLFLEKLGFLNGYGYYMDNVDGVSGSVFFECMFGIIFGEIRLEDVKLDNFGIRLGWGSLLCVLFMDELEILNSLSLLEIYNRFLLRGRMI